MRFASKPVCIGIVCLAAVVSATVLISGCGLFSKGHFVTELYQYFPKESSFYVEFKPSEQDAQKMLAAVDKLSAKYGALSPLSHDAGSKQSKYVGQVQKISHQVSQVFSKDFEPQAAIGYWIDEVNNSKQSENTTASLPENLQDHSLAVMPLKPNVTFETIKQDLKLVVAAPVEVNTTAGKIATYTEVNNKLVYAVVQNNLLISQDTKTLATVLEVKADKNKSLISSSVVDKNLGRLHAERQGTLVFQQNKLVKQLQEKQLQAIERKSAQNDFVSQFVRQLDNISEGSVGEINLDSKNLLVSVDMFTPMDFSKIKDATLRSELQGFYTQNGHANMSDFLSDATVFALGVNGLDHVVTIYENILQNTPQTSGRVDAMKSQLKAIGLDWKQNVVGMFKNTTGLVLAKQAVPSPVPNVMLLLNNSGDTQKTIDTLVKRISPLAGAPSEKTVNGKKISTLSSPLLPAGISFGDVGSGFYALGLSPALHSLPSLGNAKSLSTDATYKTLTTGLVNGSVFFVFANWKDLVQQVPQLSKGGSLPLEAVLLSGSWDGGVSRGQFRLKLDGNKF